MAKKPQSRYRLQRWWITKGWTTLETSQDRSKILQSFKGWKRQIVDGSFRVKKGTRTVAQRKGSLQKKIEKQKR